MSGSSVSSAEPTVWPGSCRPPYYPSWPFSWSPTPLAETRNKGVVIETDRWQRGVLTTLRHNFTQTSCFRDTKSEPVQIIEKQHQLPVVPLVRMLKAHLNSNLRTVTCIQLKWTIQLQYLYELPWLLPNCKWRLYRSLQNRLKIVHKGVLLALKSFLWVSLKVSKPIPAGSHKRVYICSYDKNSSINPINDIETVQINKNVTNSRG